VTSTHLAWIFAQLACHESERTTRMYDRSDDPVTLDEIERVNYKPDQ